jgi:hypothetical protein
MRNANYLSEFMEKTYLSILMQIPLSNNTRTSIRQCSVSTVTLYAIQILQNSP